MPGVNESYYAVVDPVGPFGSLTVPLRGAYQVGFMRRLAAPHSAHSSPGRRQNLSKVNGQGSPLSGPLSSEASSVGKGDGAQHVAVGITLQRVGVTRLIFLHFFRVGPVLGIG